MTSEEYMDQSRFVNKWHRAVNDFMEDKRDEAWREHRFMYDANTLFTELPRLKLLFERERAGQLPKIHQQCSCSQPEEVESNHLTCCLGVKCRECPMLLALEVDDLTPEQQDEAKAHTCVAHILTKKNGEFFDSSEGYILTVDDRMFWDRVYTSLAGGDVRHPEVPR